MRKPAKIHFPYLPKIGAALAFLALLLSAHVLFLGRKSHAFHSTLLAATLPGFYQHVSNFSITLIVYLTMGYVWLLMGIKIKPIALAGLAMIAINFIYELYIPILNTCDIIDAYYGLTAVVLSFLFLYTIHKRGLRPNPQKPQ